MAHLVILLSCSFQGQAAESLNRYLLSPPTCSGMISASGMTLLMTFSGDDPPDATFSGTSQVISASEMTLLMTFSGD